MQQTFGDLARYASRHHGLFRVENAASRGISRQRLRTLVHEGWCASVRRGVYRVCAAPQTGRQLILIEVWAHRTGAVASHRGAAFLATLVGYRVPRPEVTMPTDRNRRSKGTVHGSLWLPDQHVTVIDGIPTTRVARTLFDLAGVEPKGRVEVALDDALSRRLCTLRQVNQVFFGLARRGRRGTVTMRELLEARGEQYVPPASELERLARRVFTERGVPMPDFEIHLGAAELIGRVDCVWREAKLVVELDGHRWHGSHSARERDRRRDNELVAAGWRVIRFTWDDLKGRPAEVSAQVLAALAAAR